MRTVLRLLGTRYGIALMLVVLVVAAVGTGRVLLDNGTKAPNDAFGPTVAAVPTSADPLSSLGDDSIDEPSITAAPSLSKGTADPTTVATRFVKAWLRKPGITAAQWRAGLKVDATAEVMDSLAETDPADVPATTITGPVQLQSFGDNSIATIPADGGSVVLNLQVLTGRWQVTSIDWQAS